jgi:hypothetical protein
MATDQTERDRLLLLLEICEDFFSHTSPAVRNEADTLLRAHGITGGPSWLIDMLGFTRLRLQHQRYTSTQVCRTDP